MGPAQSHPQIERFLWSPWRRLELGLGWAEPAEGCSYPDMSNWYLGSKVSLRRWDNRYRYRGWTGVINAAEIQGGGGIKRGGGGEHSSGSPFAKGLWLGSLQRPGGLLPARPGLLT